MEFLEKLVAFGELTRPKISLLIYLGVLIGGIIGASHLHFDIVFALIFALIASFGVTVGGYALNDYLDRDIDVIAHGHRPLPTGRLTPKQVLWISIIFFSIGITFSIAINWICFWIAISNVLLLFFYEKYFKNQGITGNICIGYLSSSVFLFGGAAVGKIWLVAPLSLLAFLVNVGREVLLDVRDMEGDRKRRNTLPLKIGIDKSVIIGCFFLALTIGVTPIPYFLGIFNWLYLGIIAVGDIILIYVIYATIKDIENIRKTPHIVRIAMAIGILAFLIGRFKII